MTGSGTQQDPYIVMNCDDFCNMTGGTGIFYKLGADIDFAQSDRNSSDGAIAIKCRQIDGDGHSVSNFFRRVDYNNGKNAMFEYNNIADYDVYFKNICFKGIYLVGGVTQFLNITGAKNAVIQNCRIALKINDTTDSSGYQAPVFIKTGLEDCELLIEGTSDITKQIFSDVYSFLKGSLLKIYLTFFLSNSVNSRPLFRSPISHSGITGKIVCKELSSAYLIFTDTTVMNSYFAVDFETITNFAMNGNFSGINFYDKEVMSRVAGKITQRNNLYALTTEQCKNAEYLQSINFPCISGDVI